MVAGHVRITNEPPCNDDRTIVKVHFDANKFHLGLEGRTNRIVAIPPTQGKNWWELSPQGTHYSVLGKIRRSLTVNEIQLQATLVAEKMRNKGYDYVRNNCRDFVNDLYSRIKV